MGKYRCTVSVITVLVKGEKMKTTDRALPYIDLHLHLDGSLSLDAVKQLAALSKRDLPEEDEKIMEKLIVDEGRRNTGGSPGCRTDFVLYARGSKP